jgi:hypothetical protein
VTNFGLNTKYQPTARQPVRIYYGEFDDTGRSQVIEAQTSPDGALLPIRGKTASQAAIPSLREKFPTFHSFASATLEEIYSPERLASAERFEIQTLESGIFWNETVKGGPMRLVFEPLPRLAQIAPAFGVQIVDVNLDGRADIYLVHNFWGPQRETGRMDGGVSLLLLGAGDRKFTPIWPDVSGLVIAADAKSLTVCDFNRDGRPDFVASVNDGAPAAFENRVATQANPLIVRLRGTGGNPTGVGARVTLRTSAGRTSSAEMSAGSGYLSQSSSQLFFALAPGEKVRSIAVRWPDGRLTERAGPVEGRQIVIDQRAVARRVK